MKQFIVDLWVVLQNGFDAKTNHKWIDESEHSEIEVEVPQKGVSDMNRLCEDLIMNSQEILNAQSSFLGNPAQGQTAC